MCVGRMSSHVSYFCKYCSNILIRKKARWEDVSSRGGGKWVLTIDPKRRKRDLDGYWLHLVSADSLKMTRFTQQFIIIIS